MDHAEALVPQEAPSPTSGASRSPPQPCCSYSSTEFTPRKALPAGAGLPHALPFSYEATIAGVLIEFGLGVYVRACVCLCYTTGEDEGALSAFPAKVALNISVDWHCAVVTRGGGWGYALPPKRS